MDHVDDADQTPPREHLRDRLLTINGLRKLAPAEPLIDDLIFGDTLAQLSGPAGAFKSFLAIGGGCSLALGRNYGPFTVPKARNVVYVAAEGASGMMMRILAWCESRGIDPDELEDQLYVLPEPMQLGNPIHVSQMTEIVDEVNAGLLIADTRARCTSGLEENSASQQGEAIEAADSIRQAAHTTVWAIHHTPRSGRAGRGSNAWDGAVWSDLRTVTPHGLHAKIHCAKHKEVEDGCDHWLRLVNHTVSEKLAPGVEEKRRRTLVVSESAVRPEDLVRDNSLILLNVFEIYVPPSGLTGPQIRDLAEEAGIPRSTFYRVLKRLVKLDCVEQVGSKYIRTDKEYAPNDD